MNRVVGSRSARRALRSTLCRESPSNHSKGNEPLGPTTTSSITSIARRSAHRDAGKARDQKAVRSRSLAWFDVLIAVGCLGGLTASTLYQVQVRAADFGASDFKTLYASVWCFTHRMNAYTFANIQHVFVANGVVQPEKWFGHAPVYPLTTLAFLYPLALIGMVPAAFVLTILSGTLMAVAVTALMRYSANNFGMGSVWRMAIAILCASLPLIGFGMNLGNVSVAASAFCILAFVWRDIDSPWIQRGLRWVPGAALAAAFVLKPHLGFWVGLGMLLLPERAARAVVVRAGALVAGFTALTAAVMAAVGTLGLQTHAYLAMLSAEASTGSSMSATSRTVLPVVSEITSLDSILGFWISNPVGPNYADLHRTSGPWPLGGTVDPTGEFRARSAARGWHLVRTGISSDLSPHSRRHDSCSTAAMGDGSGATNTVGVVRMGRSGALRGDVYVGRLSDREALGRVSPRILASGILAAPAGGAGRLPACGGVATGAEERKSASDRPAGRLNPRKRAAVSRAAA